MSKISIFLLQHLNRWVAMAFLGHFFLANLSASPISIKTFVTLKAAIANMRTGPGKIYPRLWVLCAPGLPLKVLSVFDMWCKVRDPLGGVGWIHKKLLSRQKQAFTLRTVRLLSAPSHQAKAKARVQAGASLRIKKIYPHWFAVTADGITGYIPRHMCWAGLDPDYALLKKK